MKFQRPTPRRNESGMVMVMAVVALALMMILLLALFEGVTHQSRGALGDASMAREKMLADSAVALVEGQIAQASSQANQAWISQPGLLRTYAANATRKPTACYKLYSTPGLTGMIDTTGTLAFMASDIPSDWSSRPADYTDLNAPATSGLFGQTLYPILDPSAVTAVQGISLDTGSVQMPVAWLYELQDGTLGPAGNGTAANPIVARMAFWTDDDTSKININTAGCGSGWNTPRVNSTDDVSWSTTQPAAGEYSGYPGHPATTSLVETFGSGTTALSPQQLLALTPRYAWGGSQFGAQSTTVGQAVTPKMDRLYASLDELCFSSATTSGSQRAANPLSASQLDVAHFILTAHSQSPETTMLGEPRVAIWPVSDGTTGAPGITATDRAIISAATVGTGTTSVRAYYFQRNSPLNPLDDFDPTKTSSAPTASNLQLFSDLVNRGAIQQPGYGAALSTKYSGAKWTQILLEITDFIHGLNAVDPNSSITPFAPANSTGAGYGFVEPLTTTYGSGTSQLTLRGLGRCPTLSSLTLVVYVSGFQYKVGTTTTTTDYELTPDADGSSWNTNFAVGASQNRWPKVTGELIRAFVVPCTFQPGCAYPEVSDNCDIQISGLNGIQLTGSPSDSFGFPATANSRLLSDALTVPPADRAWGGNEGPSAWRAASLATTTGAGSGYPFAGTTALVVPALTTVPFDTHTNGPSAPRSWARTLSFSAVNGIKVNIRDHNGATLQSLTLNLPAFSIHAPTVNGECDHADGSTPATAHSDWATNAGCVVVPSYYMNLRNRILATQNSRAAFIQAGDISRSVEAGPDLRVIAGLSAVPASLFNPHPGYSLTTTNLQGGSHAQNLRFADGTSACFALGTTKADLETYPPAVTADLATPATASYALTRPNASASYPATAQTLITVSDWSSATSPAYYNIFNSASCSVPTGSNGVHISGSIPGDWDTGPGFATDGAQINLPDSGTSLTPSTAYFSLTDGQLGAATQRTPNALVPSPVIFGSLPSGINPSDSVSTSTTALSTPWQTLLFCPYPAANTPANNSSCTPYAVHPGATTPPDHLILDNFWMPVVEPYAISTCMATAGKINLNDQIAPFTYLHRRTALRALLDGLRIPAIPVAAAANYKSSGTAMTSIWNTVDKDSTIAQIENRFANGSVDAYLSESEICTVPLVPTEPSSPFSTNVAATQTALASFWSGAWSATPSMPDGGLTGDNLRELPYAQLYSRLTTRSNSYTVHVRVQVLKKLTHDPDQNVWKEGTDLVLGDWRGSYEIERYLDPAAKAPAAGSPLGPYKFRIVSTHAFTP